MVRAIECAELAAATGEDERDVERNAFEDQLKRLLEDNDRLKADARAARAALSDAQLDERRKAASHYRAKLDDYKRANPPTRRHPEKRDAAAFGPPPPRPDDPLAMTLGKQQRARPPE